MPTQAQRTESLEGTRKSLRTLAELDVKSLARTEELGTSMDFSRAVDPMEEVLGIVRLIDQRDISILPTPELSKILKACSHISNLVSEIKSFNHAQENPGGRRKEIFIRVDDAYDNVLAPLLPLLAFIGAQKTDYSQLEREARGLHAKMQTEAQDFQTLMETTREEAAKALAAVQEQAAKGGVSSNAHVFVTEADAFGMVARRWLIATIATSSVTLVLAVSAFVASFIYVPPTTQAAVQYVVSKVILLSVLSFGIFWCARNYKAKKHNETLNKHRANALMTFQTFYDGTSDPPVKDAVLLHAAQAAFAPRPTGYDGADQEAQHVNPVVEVLGKSLSSGE